LHIFVSNVPSKLAAIDDAVKSENRDDLLTAIRSLTATSIQFGADTLRDHCLALEAICSEGAVDEINTMVKKLEQSAWDTAAVLKSMTINTSAA
jgi:hypothetical protein